LNFDLVVDPEIVTQGLVELPAQLVIFHRRNDSKQAGTGKKFLCQALIVDPEFHLMMH
jgi:hypothetical protein